MSEIRDSAERTELSKPDISEPDAVRADLQATRAELADTVNELSRKLDVKARTREKVSQGTSKVSEAAGRLRQSVPPNVRRAVDQAAAKTNPLIQQVSEKTAPHRSKLIAGLTSCIVVVALIVVANRRHHAPNQIKACN